MNTVDGIQSNHALTAGLSRVPDWLLLTGTAGQLERVWQEYENAATSADRAAPSAEAYVINQAGTVRQAYRTGSGPQTAAMTSSFAVLFAGAVRQALAG